MDSICRIFVKNGSEGRVWWKGCIRIVGLVWSLGGVWSGVSDGGYEVVVL